MIQHMIPLSQAAWRKAQASTQNDACVEVADLGKAVGVRDSKNPTGPALVFSAAAMGRFVAEVKAGRVDL